MVGLGRSGQATARYLLSHVSDLDITHLTLVDSAQSKSLEDFYLELQTRAREQYGARLQIDAHFGVNQVPESANKTLYDLCVITPGLAPHTQLSQSAYHHSRQVISELELAYMQSPPGLIWVAVTGTNGKTTTTELMREVLSAGQVAAEEDDHVGNRHRQVYSVGNIGTPALELLDRVGEGDIFVAEVSSFQAARMSSFTPAIAALINLSSDHLDWHSDIASYAADKCKIFANSNAGNLVLVPGEDCLHPEARPVIAQALDDARKRGAIVQTVHAPQNLDFSSRDEKTAATVALPNVNLVQAEALPLPVNQLPLRGQHNVINAAFATAVARYFTIPDARIAAVLRKIRPQPHRMQEVGRYADVLYVNDSKSTNPDSAIQALTAYVGLRLILLLGGQSKSSDFAFADNSAYLDLARFALDRVDAIVLFGQAADELRSVFDLVIAQQGMAQAEKTTVQATESDSLPQPPAKQKQQLFSFDTMEQAIRYACDRAQPQQVVLLSPAHASFDEFDNYEERGDFFVRLVKECNHA